MIDHPAARTLARRHRLRPWEAVPWILALGFYFAFPKHLGFGTELLVTILFALSLDLVLGYAGIVTLGHAAFFGAGAYTVGMLAKHGLWNEPTSGLLLAASPTPGPYYGEWTLNVGGLEWYRGRVLEASVDDLPIPPGAVPGSPRLERRLRADSGMTLRVRFVAGPPSTGLGPILRIVDPAAREIVLLGPDRRDLVFRFQTRASLLRLDQPDLRLDAGMSGIAPGEHMDQAKGQRVVFIGCHGAVAVGN